MKRIASWSSLIVFACLVMTGCGQRAATQSYVQPKRSLDELYVLAAQVNADADPYLLGSGDGLGQRTFDIYVEEVVMEHPKP